jgi:uncharacterized protein (TIGR02611 family)
MQSLKRRWKRIPQAVRKPLVFIVGSSVIGTGLILLIFPGPGWAAIFVGFAILATEFAFAEKARDWMIKELKTFIKNSKLAFKALWKRIRGK